MPSPYANYVPRIPSAGQPQRPEYPPPDQAGALALFKQYNPSLFAARPQVTATFGGRPVAMMAPPMQAGSMFNGGRVMAGMGGQPRSGPVVSSGPTRSPWASVLSQAQPQQQQQPAAGQQPAGNPIAEQAQRDLDAANKANDDRYHQLLQNEGADKQELLTAMNGWNPLISQAQQDAGGVRQRMNSGWDAILNLAGQNGIQSDLERERRRAKNEQGAASQSLVNRGLTNTTIADSTRRGIVDDSALREQGIYDAQKQRELGVRQNMMAQTIPTEMRLNEGTQQIGMEQLRQLIPALMNMNRERQGIIERRSDQGPQTALIAQLLSQQGATQQSNQQIANALQAAQTGATNQYQQLLNSILGQMPAQYGGGGGARNSGNTFGGGFRSRTGGLGGNASGEQHTGASDVNNGGYNRDPSGADRPQQPPEWAWMNGRWQWQGQGNPTYPAPSASPPTMTGAAPWAGSPNFGGSGNRSSPLYPAGQAPEFTDAGELDLNALGLGDLNGNGPGGAFYGYDQLRDQEQGSPLPFDWSQYIDPSMLGFLGLG